MSKQDLLNEILSEMHTECKRLIEHLASSEDVSIERIEASFRQMMLRIGGKFIELYIRRSDLGYDGKRTECSCGKMAEFEGYRSRQIQTVIGTARIERAYYHCPSCRSGFAPLDQELGLSRRSLSRALERAICRLAAVESFEHTVEDLYDVGGVSVSAKEAQLVSESIGAAIALQDTAEVEAVWAEEMRIEAEDRPDVLCVEVDGKIVPTREGGRELKVAAVSELVPSTKAESQRLEVGKTTYLGRFDCAQDFGRHVWVEAARRGVEDAKVVIGLGDGAPWIWNLMGEQFPNAVQILDFYHASEHLWKLGNALYGEGTERTKRFASYKQDQVKAGEVNKVIAALKRLKVADRDKQNKIRLEIGYLQENKDRMQYPIYRERGYHIGSGVVESACKQFGARLDQAGMRWIEPGAGAIAALRALKLSGRWDTYWKPARPPLYA